VKKPQKKGAYCSLSCFVQRLIHPLRAVAARGAPIVSSRWWWQPALEVAENPDA
jgi:hypothetical protein